MKNRILRVNAAICHAASVVGHKEHDGPLGELFDIWCRDDRFKQKTWEKSESEMQRLALSAALTKGGISEAEIDALFSGDLLNQCIGSAYGLSEFDIPYFGLYGACSTAVEGLILSSLLISGGSVSRCAALSSSHFCSAEQQYRNPLEYGGQRSPTAQWTVTGAGAFILSDASDCSSQVIISEAMPGIVRDCGINDASNMGAAMAPAAADTLLRYFAESRTSPSDYSAIFSGDLGGEGSVLLREFMSMEGYEMGENYFDCGSLIFDPLRQDVHSGGSGCGCSAVVLASYILPKLKSGELRDALLIGTGAMMSPSSLKQGLSIPAIAHLIKLERRD